MRLQIEIAGENDGQVNFLVISGRNFRYPIEFRQQNLHLREANVLALRVVQQMRRGDDELHRRIRFQLKLANDRDILAIKQLERRAGGGGKSFAFIFSVALTISRSTLTSIPGCSNSILWCSMRLNKCRL